MRRIVIAAAVVAIGGTAAAAPRAAHAQTVVPACATVPGLAPNTYQFSGELVNTSSLVGAGSLVKTYNFECPFAALNGLAVGGGFTPYGGTYAQGGFGGNCLVSTGPYVAGGCQLFIGDTVGIGEGPSLNEVELLTPHTTNDVPCGGLATETFDYVSVQN